MLRRAKCSPTTLHDASGRGQNDRSLPTCSCPAGATAWMAATSAERFTPYLGRSGCVVRPIVVGRDCTTCGMHSHRRHYYAGENAERPLPILSAYLGHVHWSDTFWYLSAMPELMHEAMSRLEIGWGDRLRPQPSPSPHVWAAFGS